MLELEELMKLLKVNNPMYNPTTTGPATGSHMNMKTNGPMVIVSPASATAVGAPPGGHYDDITDVSGLNIDVTSSRHYHRPQQQRVIANEDSINSGSD